MRWVELRRALAAGGRAELLRFVMAGTTYRPLAHQERGHLASAVDGETSHKLFVGGIGAGKTKWGGAESVLLALANPGVWGVCMSPTFDQVLHVQVPEVRGLCDELAGSGYPLARRWRISEATLELVCGGRIFFRSFDRADSIRGFNFGWGWLDEPEQVARPGYVFDVVAGRLRDPRAVIRQLHCTTTPKGIRGVVGKFLEQRGLADGAPTEEERARQRRAWWVARAATSANTHLPAGYVESLRAGYSKRQWAQEVEARLLRPETSVWPEFTRARHLLPYAYELEAPYDLAVDWGTQYPHLLAIQRIPGTGRAVIFAEFCDDNVPRDHLRSKIRQIVKSLGKPPENCAADRAVKSENRWFQSEFPSTRLVTMRTRAQQDIASGLEVVRVLLDPVDSTEPNLYIADAVGRNAPRRGIARCLENYRYRQQADGTLSEIPWKDNIHDHGADALRYWAVGLGDESVGAFVADRVYGPPRLVRLGRRHR